MTTPRGNNDLENPARPLAHPLPHPHGRTDAPGFRREVAETLGGRVYSFYGTTETGGMAGECDRGAGCRTVRKRAATRRGLTTGGPP